MLWEGEPQASVSTAFLSPGCCARIMSGQLPELKRGYWNKGVQDRVTPFHRLNVITVLKSLQKLLIQIVLSTQFNSLNSVTFTLQTTKIR